MRTIGLSFLALTLAAGCKVHTYNHSLSTAAIPTITPQVEDAKVTWSVGDNLSTTVQVKVTYDAKRKLKEVTGPDFKYTVERGVGKLSEGSRLYAGATLPIFASVSLTGLLRGDGAPPSPTMPNETALLLRSDLQWAREIANYQIIAEARAKGAQAILQPTYDWKVSEEGAYKKGLIGQKPVNYTRTYEVKVFSRAVNFKPATHD